MEFQNPLLIAFYAIGIIAASWHFAYGIWLFSAKWGLVSGERAQRRFGYLCLAIAIAFVAIGGVSMYAFLSTPMQPMSTEGLQSIVMR
jgi:succinate dehydrogenase / fumarate reductase cytochrome b subunit